MENNKNFLFFALIAILIVIGSNSLRTWLAPNPMPPTAVVTSTPTQPLPHLQPIQQPLPSAASLRERQQVIGESARVPFMTPSLSGSVNLKGGRLDDLTLNLYRETVDPASPLVHLLSPAGSDAPHNAEYADFGWLAESKDVAVPTSDTVWQSDAHDFSNTKPIKLTWASPQGLTFEREIAVDDHYMFTITDHVTNKSVGPVQLYPYGAVTRQGNPVQTTSNILHEGPLGVLDGTLQEFKYKKLMDEGKKSMPSQGGWIGITSKYWLVAMSPPNDEKLDADFVFDGSGVTDPNQGHFQSDYRGNAVTVATGSSVTHVTHFFAGAKEISLLDKYATAYDIPRLDRAIDFGWFYFLTKPFLYLVTYLGKTLGSLGFAIMVFTVMLKLITLPLSLKSNHSMARMKKLQPEMNRIKERFADDKMRQQQETMELFKREKVNPMSGCAPTLIQIPIFFALYKVLYVGIEMRQAPFYGWIHDMAAPDPTSWVNLFGLASWNIPAQVSLNVLGFFTLYIPPAIHIGAWPLLMGCSMFLQQRLSPQAMDKSQQRMFMFMPFLMTYILSNMPAGLVIYWTWSNLLSIAQQWFIMRRDARGKV
jgi:YidC/Oxa1 family membrane protein insertase